MKTEDEIKQKMIDLILAISDDKNGSHGFSIPKIRHQLQVLNWVIAKEVTNENN